MPSLKSAESSICASHTSTSPTCCAIILAERPDILSIQQSNRRQKKRSNTPFKCPLAATHTAGETKPLGSNKVCTTASLVRAIPAASIRAAAAWASMCSVLGAGKASQPQCRPGCSASKRPKASAMVGLPRLSGGAPDFGIIFLIVNGVAKGASTSTSSSPCETGTASRSSSKLATAAPKSSSAAVGNSAFQRLRKVDMQHP
mmetsp:Transcript_44674/g.105987  ORF Transcript_44674/g.105987 Transcript_44674/m.105987 type:complete len:202 (-) Transcript_44674:4642-5247(-)